MIKNWTIKNITIPKKYYIKEYIDTTLGKNIFRERYIYKVF